MPYTTLENITGQISEARVIELTDDEQLDVVNTDRVDEAIISADAVIDGYCTARYILPFNPVPAIIAKCSLDMAIYNLYARRVETMPEVRDKNNTLAINMLKAIAKGEITLGSTATVAPPTSANSPAQIRTNDRIFTSTKMDTY